MITSSQLYTVVQQLYLMAIYGLHWKWRSLTPCQRHPSEPIEKIFGTIDNVIDLNNLAKFGSGKIFRDWGTYTQHISRGATEGAREGLEPPGQNMEAIQFLQIRWVFGDGVGGGGRGGSEPKWQSWMARPINNNIKIFIRISEFFSCKGYNVHTLWTWSTLSEWSTFPAWKLVLYQLKLLYNPIKFLLPASGLY